MAREAEDATTTETLRNGLAVAIRPLRPDDRERMARAVSRLDPESIYLRLFSHRKELTEAGLDRLMRVDPQREAALVVTTGAGADETIVGSGRCYFIDGGATRSGEVAFVVEEDYQGLGIARRLLARFAALARSRGLATLQADVLARNKPMLAVFERSGLPAARRLEGDVVHVTLTL